MLRATTPSPVNKRLKMFMFGPAGVGKTTAAIQFPNAYIIDGERGTENYDKLITDAGGVVFRTTDIHEVVEEVKALLCVKHDYRTLVIDPVTPLFNDLLDKCEAQVGADFGRHYGAANKTMKRLANLIMNLDMNVIMTAHAKTEYGQKLEKLGYTFDGWRQLDYWFDLVIELGKNGKRRSGRVAKTRIETFPDGDVFEWSYQNIRKRYDPTTLERPAAVVKLATPEQVREIKDLLESHPVKPGLIDAWFGKAQVTDWTDMPAETIAKCAQYIRDRALAPDAPARRNGVPRELAPLAGRF